MREGGWRGRGKKGWAGKEGGYVSLRLIRHIDNHSRLLVPQWGEGGPVSLWQPDASNDLPNLGHTYHRIQYRVRL